MSETGGDQSFHSKSFNKKNGKKNGGGGNVDKKKVLPTKKFPELKLMISGEGRNSNNTFSSDEEVGNVSSSLMQFYKFRCNSHPSRREAITRIRIRDQMWEAQEEPREITRTMLRTSRKTLRIRPK